MGKGGKGGSWGNSTLIGYRRPMSTPVDRLWRLIGLPHTTPPSAAARGALLWKMA